MAARLPRRTRVPQPVVEVLRLCVVLAGAALGYQAAGIFPGPVGVARPRRRGRRHRSGSGLGYAVGGILGRANRPCRCRVRSTRCGLSRPSRSSPASSARCSASLGGAAIAWPVFLIGHAAVAVPLFVFVLLACAMLGYRIGSLRRDSMIAMFGAGAGMAPTAGSSPSVAAAARRHLGRHRRADPRRRACRLPRRPDGRHPARARRAAGAGRRQRRPASRQGPSRPADAGGAAPRARRRGGGHRRPGARRARRSTPSWSASPWTPAGRCSPSTPTSPAAPPSAGVRVLNLHALDPRACARRSSPATRSASCSPRPGKEAGQAVGYLDDGTMVVVERASERSGPGGSRAGDKRPDDGQRSDGVRPPGGARRPAGRWSVTPAPVGGRGRCGALVPAAGRGERLGRGDPKALRLARWRTAARARRAHPCLGPVGRRRGRRGAGRSGRGRTRAARRRPAARRSRSSRAVTSARSRYASRWPPCRRRRRRARARRGTGSGSRRAHRGGGRGSPCGHRSGRAGHRRWPTPSSRSTPTAPSSRRSTARPLRAIQTPQGFRRSVLAELHANARPAGLSR